MNTSWFSNNPYNLSGVDIQWINLSILLVYGKFTKFARIPVFPACKVHMR